ncbi:VUT family protein [Streptomyces ipomoeae]|nr:VUT family protein [Streptomyces ipomoeae]
MRSDQTVTVALAAGYVAAVPGANYLASHVGLVPVGFGQLAPASVYLVGASLVLRDFLHERIGRDGALCALAIGAWLSYMLTDARFAVASTVAFAVSEALDWSVYGRLRRYSMPVAVLLSGVVGLIADSVLFLSLAFGNLDLLTGQILGKAWMTLAAAAGLAAASRHRRAVTR